MLDPTLVPSRLIEPASIKPIPIKEPTAPSRYRVFYLSRLFLKLVLDVVWLQIRRKLTRQEFARQLRLVFEELGGLWIKLGQLLSLRSDVFPPEFCRELSHLQSKAVGFPPEMARAILERELGGPVERFFDAYEDHPFAAASIGQIHRAHLRNEQVWVAVKVQRPYASSMFLREMAFARFMVRIVKRLWFIPNLHWDEMLWELNQILAEEIDYRYEASSTKRMRKILSKHKFYVPEVYDEYCTERILVTEFVHAVLMSDYIRILREEPLRCAAWERENNIDAKLLARRLFNSLWRQLLEDNLFHGDLHPGNIILLRDSRLSLIDFGSVGTMEKEYQKKYSLLIQSMATQDFDKSADLLFLLSGALPPRDLGEVKQKLIRCLRAWQFRTYIGGLAYKEKSMSNVANQLIRILFQYECAADWSFLRITRAQETVDQSLMYLYPEVNFSKLIRNYFRDSKRRARNEARKPEAVLRYVESMVETLKIPERLAENAMFQNWIIRRHAQVFRGSTSKFSHFVAVLARRASSGLMLGSVYLILVYAYQHNFSLISSIGSRWFIRSLQAFPRLDEGIWLVSAILILYTYYTLVNLNRLFMQRDRARDWSGE